jgi:hypothetical protein
MGGFFLLTVGDVFVLLVIVATALIWRRHQRVVPSTISPGDFFIDSMNVGYTHLNIINSSDFGNGERAVNANVFSNSN